MKELQIYRSVLKLNQRIQTVKSSKVETINSSEVQTVKSSEV